jgi:hypothetical protein
MPLQDPVVVYRAASNVEAQLICQLLLDSGIDAAVVEDMSPAGMYSLGTLDGIHNPQVFVEGSLSAKARLFITEYEQRQSQRVAPSQAESFCYHCGEVVAVGATACAACGADLGFSDEDRSEYDAGNTEWSKVSGSGADESASDLDRFRSLKKPLALFFLALLLLPCVFGLFAWVMDALTRSFRAD